MKLANARYERNGAYPMLTVEVDGREAALCTDCKPTLFDAGIVFLGPEFAGVVPPIEFTLPADDGGTTKLEGFTRDRRVVQLYADFLRATAQGKFVEGPIRIPA